MLRKKSVCFLSLLVFLFSIFLSGCRAEAKEPDSPDPSATSAEASQPASAVSEEMTAEKTFSMDLNKDKVEDCVTLRQDSSGTVTVRVTDGKTNAELFTTDFGKTKGEFGGIYLRNRSNNYADDLVIFSCIPLPERKLKVRFWRVVSDWLGETIETKDHAGKLFDLRDDAWIASQDVVWLTFLAKVDEALVENYSTATVLVEKRWEGLQVASAGEKPIPVQPWGNIRLRTAVNRIWGD